MDPNGNSRVDRPRVTLMIPEPPAFRNSGTSNNPQQQHSPYIMSAGTSVPTTGQPNWPNPFLQQMYAQRAGDFVCKQFEGLNRFTKGGLSVGEKSVVWIYAKFRKWSRKWFTHIFLFIVVLLYSIAGSLVFMTLEGKDFECESSQIKALWTSICEVCKGRCRMLHHQCNKKNLSEHVKSFQQKNFTLGTDLKERES